MMPVTIVMPAMVVVIMMIVMIAAMIIVMMPSVVVVWAIIVAIPPSLFDMTSWSTIRYTRVNPRRGCCF